MPTKGQIVYDRGSASRLVSPIRVTDNNIECIRKYWGIQYFANIDKAHTARANLLDFSSLLIAM